jgi:hypothetical protein
VEFGVSNVWSRVGYAGTGGGALGVLEMKVLLVRFRHCGECNMFLFDVVHLEKKKCLKF